MPITQRAGTRSPRRLAAAFAVAGALAAAAFVAGPAVAATQPGAVAASTATAAKPLLTLAPLSTAAQYQADVLKATNAQRTAHGLRPMTSTSCLSSLATSWAAHLAATKTFTHQSLSPFLSKCHAMAAAENIAMGNVTAQNVVTMWMNSPEHRANLLNATYTHVSIGAAKSGSTWYVVQDFSN
jgi:uncharacterized protein YkwD